MSLIKRASESEEQRRCMFECPQGTSSPAPEGERARTIVRANRQPEAMRHVNSCTK
jgi:hypothetical protein